MELKVKTRGMSNPKGKPKVLFACHPEDFNLYFTEISEDLLNTVNCAVYYSESMDENLADFVDEMQLIAFAVTEKFIMCENAAKDILLPYANEKHVPILPILLEEGLFVSFNKLCASVQLVDKYVKDPTATPYDEVLKTFLESVLVSDELAKKVRDAFDAYVFLSYRKKDRKYAQRLMHLIHENKDFRDIAIWYDEFLVPGEDFNDAIKEAFHKSSIFALAVTPSLLEAGNYVMETEYPMAVERRDTAKDIEIVPVEMYDPDKSESRTNRNLLGEAYNHLPEVQDEYRKEPLKEALIKALSKVGKKENDDSSQHNFFIGLAYMNGIDVEIDYRKGIELIKGAAESEDPCLDATEKMAHVYLQGEGVPRDIHEAIRWQKKLIEQFNEKIQQENHDHGLVTRLLKALLKLAEMEKDVGNTEEAIHSFKKALELMENLKDEVGIRESLRDEAIILSRLAGLRLILNNYKEAEKYYKEADMLYEKLASDIKTERTQKDLSVSKERLGDLYRKLKNTADAKEAYVKAFDIRKKLIENEDSHWNQWAFSAIMTKLGNIYKDMGCMKDAKEMYEQALKIDLVLAEELKTVRAWDDYSVSCVKLGDIYKAAGKYEISADYYGKAESTLKNLLGKSDSLNIKSHYAGVLGKAASVEKKRNQTERAEKMYCESLMAWKEINQFSRSVPHMHELATAYYNYGVFKKDITLVRKANEIWSKLAEMYPQYSKYRDMSAK